MKSHFYSGNCDERIWLDDVPLFGLDQHYSLPHKSEGIGQRIDDHNLFHWNVDPPPHWTNNKQTPMINMLL